MNIPDYVREKGAKYDWDEDALAIHYINQALVQADIDAILAAFKPAVRAMVQRVAASYRRAGMASEPDKAESSNESASARGQAKQGKTHHASFPVPDTDLTWLRDIANLRTHVPGGGYKRLRDLTVEQLIAVQLRYENIARGNMVRAEQFRKLVEMVRSVPGAQTVDDVLTAAKQAGA